MNCRWVPSVDVSLVRPKCCHLKLKIVFQNDDHAKMRANCVGPWKKPLHHFRSCVGSDVVVLWRQAANHVTHATACEVRDVTILAQARSDFERRLFHRRRFHPIIVTVLLWKSGNLPESARPAILLLSALLLPKRMNNKQHHRT